MVIRKMRLACLYSTAWYGLYMYFEQYVESHNLVQCHIRATDKVLVNWVITPCFCNNWVFLILIG